MMMMMTGRVDGVGRDTRRWSHLDSRYISLGLSRRRDEGRGDKEKEGQAHDELSSIEKEILNNDIYISTSI